MIDNDLDDTNTNVLNLRKCAPEALQMQVVTALIIALGSNYQADYHLAAVRNNLAELGDIILSTPFQNPDFTATIERPKPDYINQCIYLSLAKSMSLQQLQQTFKDFEVDCNRQRFPENTVIKRVTMDIDILLITLSKENSLSNSIKSNFIIMMNRYPFKAHEIIGINELIATKLSA